MRLIISPVSVVVMLCASLLAGCNFSGGSSTASAGSESPYSKDLQRDDFSAVAGPIKHTTSLSRVPLPSEQVAEVNVKNYVSTLKSMDIAYVGKQIPYTYSDGKISNSRGYNWWVSKHFALKTDLPEDKATLYLELLEMSYPHYVTLFGMEPPNIQRQRIAVVYGASRESTRESMLDDGFRRGVHTYAGGETMYYNRAGYSFPSHRQQHQRYIVIHETMHAFHMALNGHSTWAPNWITEGMADSVAHHVYDPKNHQLTVMVFDRAPMNYVETGLKQYAEGNQPSIAQINDDPALKRGLNFFIVHFLLSDPERAQYFALFRDRLMQANPHSEGTLPTANALLKETFPDWQKVERQFASYVEQVRSSFHIASGPWEQEGNRYFIRSGKQKQIPRLDIALPGNYSKPSNPLMDFPSPDKSSLIQLQPTSAFAAGLLVEFVEEQITRGKVGIGLGLVLSDENRRKRETFVEKSEPLNDSYLQIMIEQGKYLVIDGHNLDTYRLGIALSDDVREQIAQTNTLGLSLSVAKQRLRIKMLAGNAEQSVSYALTNEVLDNLLQGDVSLLADSVGHMLTPYLPSDTQRSREKLPVAWLEKKWSDKGSLFRACEQGKAHFTDCPKAMENLFNHAFEHGKDSAYQALVQQMQASFVAELRATQRGDLASTLVASTLANLALTIEHHQNQPFLRVMNGSAYPAEMAFVQDENWKLQQASTGTMVFEPQSDSYISLQMLSDAKDMQVEANVNWQGLNFRLRDRNSVQPFDGVNLQADYSRQKDALSVSVKLTGPYSGQSSGAVRFEIYPSDAAAEPVQVLPVAFAPYQVVSEVARFDLRPQVTEVKIRVVADLVVDGEDIQLSEEMYL